MQGAFGTWQNNVFTMNKKNALADDPLAGIRKKIGELKDDINQVKGLLPRPSILSWIWKERNWSIAAILVLATSIAGGVWYVSGLILDRHIVAAVAVSNSPIQADIRRIDGDVQQVKAMVGVLQTQIAAQRYSKIPPKELKAHKEELNQLKTTLAQLPPTSPGYWPVAFQIIELASQSNFAGIGNLPEGRESSYDNVKSSPPGGFGVISNRRAVLKNHVEGLIFKNCIIRFEPNVLLVNDVFVDCIFIFPTVQFPSQPLQKIATTLLASDLSRVTLNAS